MEREGRLFHRKWTIAGEFSKNTGKRAEGCPPSGRLLRVRVTTLGAARFLRSLMRASGMRRDAVYMKLDVEGSEVALLKGLLVTEARRSAGWARSSSSGTTRLIGPARPPPCKFGALVDAARRQLRRAAVAWH